MSRRMRILRNVGIGLAALIAVVLVGGLIVVQTDWFRNFVRQQIITATEDGTGGKVDIRSFSFSPRRLEAVVTDFVIHGKEPAGAAPFVRAARVQVNIRILTSLRRILDISYLGVERPEVNIMVLADGSTNIPEPKDKKKSDTTVLDSLIDLAVDRFLISNGLITYNSHTQPLDVRGNNLRAQLSYNLLTKTYKGDISLQPIYVIAGKNTPVVFTVAMPVTIEQTRVILENAKIATPESELTIDGSLADLNHPKTAARINGHIALADLKKLGDLPLDVNGRNLPSMVNVAGNAEIAGDRIEVSGFRLGLGKSNIEASGTLKDPQGNGALEFKATLAVDEAGRIAKIEGSPAGTLLANGKIKLDAANNYQIAGEVEGRDLSITQGGQRIRGVSFHTAANLDPHKVDLKGLRLSALGGQFAGDVYVQDFARYSVNGRLQNFNVQNAMRALGQKPLPYDGTVSGPVQAHGDLKSPGAKLSAANAQLAIAPGRSGVPVSGRINAQYNGATNNIDLANSYIALPNTRLNLSGSLNKQLNLELTSRNLNDLLAAAGPNPPAIQLEGGQARFTGVVTGGLSAPRVSGQVSVTQFSVEGRRFDSLGLDVAAAANRASVSNGLLRRGPMQTQFKAAAGLVNWSPQPTQSLQATVSVRNGDLADAMVLAGQPPAGYAGALTADANIGGTIGNPTGSADIQVLSGVVSDEPFDRISAKVNLADQLITIPAASLQSGASQVNLTAEFQHPRDSLTTGQIHAHVQSNQLSLKQVRSLQKQWPATGGELALNADIRGSLANSEFQLSAVNADAAARGLQFEGQNYGDATLRATTASSTVSYDLTSNFAGSDTKVTGRTQLTRDYPTTATANFRSLPIEKILVLAKRADIPAKGILSGTADFNGTIEKPLGSVNLELANAVVYDEPIDRVRARATYLEQRIDVPLLEVVAGPSRIQATARYDHPAGSLESGEAQFRVTSSRIELARIKNVEKARPGLSGALQMTASGAATIQKGNAPILWRDLNADVSARGISAQGKNFGDLTLKAVTDSGRLNFTLDSNLASAAIQGRGNAQLSGDYPLDAQLTFRDVAWSRIQPLLGPSSGPQSFEASTEGQVTVSGPAMKTDQLSGALSIPRLEVSSIAPQGSRARPIAIRNQGPISAKLDRGLIRIESAHLVGPQTDVNASGTVSLVQAQAIDVEIRANSDIGIVQNFSRDVYSSGKVTLAAAVSGTIAKPLVNGRLDLQNASINHVDVPNGLSNANGSIVFNGNTATIRNMTAQSGGGKVSLSGFVTYSDMLRLGIHLNANGVRVRTEQGVSIAMNASLNLTGTTQGSLASGTVTLDRITYAPHSDLGSMLTRVAPPIQAAAPDALLANMRLDIRVTTAAATGVQADLAQNLQVVADVRVRGTAAVPGVLGRITITRGELVFFGSKYRVSQGTIGFYNPVRIEPVLDITLETQAKGVNVVLSVSGPVDNMKLSYTSEPPLQFDEIVSLLASGKTPTSDPTRLANQPAQPQQSFQQMGETAIVSKAIADPIASRLERVFGVSQLKIDPTFTSGSDLPQARVTLQQQVATNLVFTYVTALEDPNTQIVRIEWTFNPRWSALANRDENGIFSVNFLYKKQFR